MIQVVPLEGIPEVRPGDDLAALLGNALERAGGPGEGDVVVVSQKVVSKAEVRVEQTDDHLAVILREARAAYTRWGAHAKVTDLDTCYPHLAVTPDAAGSVRADTLDIASFLKASQAIAAETHLDRLLARLMRVVIENAGAQTGALLLPHHGQWTIQAEAAVGDEALRVLAEALAR